MVFLQFTFNSADCNLQLLTDYTHNYNAYKNWENRVKTIKEKKNLGCLTREEKWTNKSDSFHEVAPSVFDTFLNPKWDKQTKTQMEQYRNQRNRIKGTRKVITKDGWRILTFSVIHEYFSIFSFCVMPRWGSCSPSQDVHERVR